MNDYDPLCIEDVPVTLIIPIAKDGFTGHGFTMWKDMVFDSSERFALKRELSSFERCTGDYDKPKAIYVMVPPANQTKSRAKTK